MAAPTCSASLDKASYLPGETMTLTVNYSDPDQDNLTVTVVVTDSSGLSSAPVTATAVIDPLTIQVSSDPARTWTLASDNGSVAVFSAVA
jgi:hypothetical protein